MNNRIANDLIRYAELVEDSALISPEEMNCASLMRLAAEALAQPEQEPVAWMREGWGPDCGPYIEFYRDDEMGWRDRKEWTPLYTTPPQRKPLTDEQIDEAWSSATGGSIVTDDMRAFARTIYSIKGDA